MDAFFTLDDKDGGAAYRKRVHPLEAQLLIHMQARKYSKQQQAATEFWKYLMQESLILTTRWGAPQ